MRIEYALETMQIECAFICVHIVIMINTNWSHKTGRVIRLSHGLQMAVEETVVYMTLFLWLENIKLVRKHRENRLKREMFRTFEEKRRLALFFHYEDVFKRSFNNKRKKSLRLEI